MVGKMNAAQKRRAAANYVEHKLVHPRNLKLNGKLSGKRNEY